VDIERRKQTPIEEIALREIMMRRGRIRHERRFPLLELPLIGADNGNSVVWSRMLWLNNDWVAHTACRSSLHSSCWT